MTSITKKGGVGSVPEHVYVSQNKSGNVNTERRTDAYFPEFPNIALVETLP